MLTVNRMTRWQAFIWLWRHDSEARWLWFRYWLMRADLRIDVQINLRDFGVSRGAAQRYKLLNAR
ncbi:hypothetical protein [Methylophaga lonarensis]|uniref:hypothetical protein n=1 Tax=Methylophaga lonarensis TaxID=999151 RepID=UPI003D2DC5C6